MKFKKDDVIKFPDDDTLYKVVKVNKKTVTIVENDWISTYKVPMLEMLTAELIKEG